MVAAVDMSSCHVESSVILMELPFVDVAKDCVWGNIVAVSFLPLQRNHPIKTNQILGALPAKNFTKFKTELLEFSHQLPISTKEVF
jgi:hypothetical protein